MHLIQKLGDRINGNNAEAAGARSTSISNSSKDCSLDRNSLKRVCVTGPHPCKANRASAVVLHLSCCCVQLLTDLKDMKGLPCCFSNRKQRFGRKGLTKLSQIPVNSLAHLCFSHPRHEPLEETHQAAFHAEFRWWWFAVHLQDQTKCIMVAATIAQVHGVKQRLVTQVGEDIVNAT